MKGVLLEGFRNNYPLFVDEENFRTRCTHVYSYQVTHANSPKFFLSIIILSQNYVLICIKLCVSLDAATRFRLLP